MGRLDRAVANDKWRDIFPIYQVEVLASRFSNHAPVLLTFQKKKIFLFSKEEGGCFNMRWLGINVSNIRR
jgi:hypothetical protein